MKIRNQYDLFFEYGARIATLLVTLTGFSLILGWTFNIDALKGIWSAGINVKANTSICFLLSGISLTLHLANRTNPKLIILARLSGLFVFLTGFLTLIQHLSGINLGIDQLLFSEPAGEIATISPNRMGPPASVCFSLAGICFSVLKCENEKSKSLCFYFAIVIGIIALLPSLGYLFGAEELYRVPNLTAISFATSANFLLICIAILFSDRQGKFRQLISSEDAGGGLARRLLLPAITLPPLLGYLRILGEQNGLYDNTFGHSLLILAFMLIFIRLVWSAALVVQESDRKLFQLIESERAARSNAERANKFKDDFLATVSHELRTPLNAILGWSQLLLRKGSKADINKGLETIERNARLQAQLIEDLLDLSRIISGKLRLEMQTVNLQQILKASIEAIVPIANTKELHLEIDLDQEKTLIIGDPERLQQIFWNVLSNSVKFTPQMGTISVSIKKDKNFIKVIINDNGQGIEKDKLNQIFDRFRQADSSFSRSKGGLGIGLAVVKELVASHAGKVEVFSGGAGLGTSFEITFPSLNEHESLKYQQKEKSLSTSLSYNISLSGVSVLVVDDEADARELTSRILEEHFARVITASSMDEALLKLKTESPDILVSDIGMPHQDGYELIRCIRNLNQEQGRDIKAIALTAFIREQDQKNAINYGYDLHLPKPVDALKLVTAIDKLKNSK